MLLLGAHENWFLWKDTEEFHIIFFNVSLTEYQVGLIAITLPMLLGIGTCAAGGQEDLSKLTSLITAHLVVFLLRPHSAAGFALIPMWT